MQREMPVKKAEIGAKKEILKIHIIWKIHFKPPADITLLLICLC